MPLAPSTQTGFIISVCALCSVTKRVIGSELDVAGAKNGSPTV